MIDITPEFELLNFQVPLWYVFGRRNGPANITDLFSALEKVPLWCKTLTQNSQSTNRAVFTARLFLPLRLLGQAVLVESGILNNVVPERIREYIP